MSKFNIIKQVKSVATCLSSVAVGCLIYLSPATPVAFGDVVAGPAFSNFQLTLEPGERIEAAGPFYYHERTGDEMRWAVPPLMSLSRNHAIDSVEFDLAYPVITYDRYGDQYRFQIFQLFNFAGGTTQEETNVHRFSLFPFYMHQRSEDPERNYVSILPFYGHLENRLFRDEIDYILFPLWAKTRKRDVITENYLYPIYHRRTGPGRIGWQVWPLVGHETKVPTTVTNHWGDELPVPGHENWFVLWPLFIDSRSGIGGTNPTHAQFSIPFYSIVRSPNRDSTSVPFVLGWTSTHDREKKYREIGAPWPLIVFRRGENSHINRVWPVYSRGTNQFLESSWYGWVVYKYNRVHAEALDRERTRWLLFLYSDTIERNTETGGSQRRRDCWPLFINRRDWDGNQRLQVLALLEPILPNSKSIERDYSQVWSLWRSQKNGKTGATSQSLLWNLYRRDRTAEMTRFSALFGLVQHTKTGDASQWRFFWWPRDRSTAPAEDEPKNPPTAQIPPASE